MTPHTISGRCALTGNNLELRIEEGLLADVRVYKAPDDDPICDTIWIAPGFVDLQVNGYQGSDLNAPDLDVATVVSLAHKLLAAGTTTFLPTLITGLEEQLKHALEAIALARRSHPALQQAIPCVHLEGPHISAEDGARGAHPLQYVRPPDLAAFDRWQDAAEGTIGLMTLSPHWAESPAYIRALVARGVRVALGHTHAMPQQISAAVDAGATLSTHLGNAIAALLPRHPNPIWTQLAEDRLSATFIADGHHLPAETLKAMLRAKGIERSILVSDAVALGGMAPGAYEASIGGRVELSADGRLSMVPSNLLAGAALPLKDDVAWLVHSSLSTLAEAVRMASLNPGRLLGKPAPYTVGAPAELIQFRLTPVSGLQIVTAIRGGQLWRESQA